MDREHRVLRGGVVAGLTGGVVLWAFMLTMAVASGGDVWPVFKGPGAPFLGARAVAPGFDLVPILMGAACHLLIAMGWAIPFARFIDGQTKAVTVVAGGLWGIVVWFGMFFVLLPAIGLGAMARAAPVGLAIVEHVLFGLAVALAFLPFLRTRLHPMAGAH
jgi:hypothetical protein